MRSDDDRVISSRLPYGPSCDFVLGSGVQVLFWLVNEQDPRCGRWLEAQRRSRIFPGITDLLNYPPDNRFVLRALSIREDSLTLPVN